MEGERISRVKARGSLDAAITAVCSEPAIAKDDLRAWIRTEAEAALLWPFHSPAVPEGPYAKIDIGAGTTNASISRVVADPETGSAYSEAWRRALPKLSAPAEQAAWTNHSIFFIGGGSLVSPVAEYLRRAP